MVHGKRSSIAWLMGLALMALMALSACGVESKQSAPTTTRPQTRPEVTVTDTGAGAKVKLRLHLRRGTRTNLRVKATTSIAQTISGRRRTVAIPPVTEDIALRIVDVRNDVASFRLEITGVELGATTSLSEEQAQRAQASLQRLVGLATDGKINAKGKQLSSKVRIPSSVPAELRQMVQQLNDQFSTLSVPLPDEAVGKGATWTRSSTATLSGARVAIRSDYRLTDVEGGLFTLAVTQHQTAEPQPFDLTTLPAGAKARIVDWDVTTSGTSSLTLGNLFPEATLHSSGHQTFTITPANEQPRTITQQLVIDAQIADLGN